MLEVLFFASLREKLGTGRCELVLPEDISSVDELARHLASGGDEGWQELLDAERVLVAVNQTIVDRGHRLEGDEEVAFFPPVTGG